MKLAQKAQQKLETLPSRPGVYLFRGRVSHSANEGDAPDEVLYVGKARNLRSRVRSYFQDGTSDVRFFITRLRRELEDIETFVADTETEAALLENQLIKKYKPRYNVKLRDDKEYLSLRLKTNTPFPRLEVVRRPKVDGARYFGPYASATAARQTLRLVNRHFQLRTCTDSEMRSRTRPCLQYQIDRCPGPCVVDVDRDRYKEQVESVSLFLAGRHDELVTQLKARMTSASEALEFEQAAVLRDQMRAVERVRESQRVTSVATNDQDVIAFFRQADQVEFAVLQLRAGRLTGVTTFDLHRTALPDDELVASFVSEWYERAPVPDEVLLPIEIEAMDGLSAWLSGRHRSRTSRRAVRIYAPQRGKGRKLLELASDNAEHAFTQKRRAKIEIGERLAEVQHKLRLPHLPHHIECIDVSHTGGEDTVAAIVALADGAPDKGRYRSFHVQQVRGGDDYGAMYEVLSRRLKRGRDGEEGWSLPDLLVVDGGKGQLGIALAVLRDLRVTVPVAALAKEKENALGEKRVDRVYLPGQKNPIAVHSTPALQMLCLARDEAHRFSNALRTKLGHRRRFTSDLDSVRGVGPKTRAKLLRAFGSLTAVREATVDELVSAGASRSQAQAIVDTLGTATPADVALEEALDVKLESLAPEHAAPIDEGSQDGGLSEDGGFSKDTAPSEDAPNDSVPPLS